MNVIFFGKALLIKKNIVPLHRFKEHSIEVH